MERYAALELKARGYEEGDGREVPVTTFGFRVARRTRTSQASAETEWRAWRMEQTEAVRQVAPVTEAEFVTVRRPGNEPDWFNGHFGRVDSVFEIARCELSNAFIG